MAAVTELDRDVKKQAGYNVPENSPTPPQPQPGPQDRDDPKERARREEEKKKRAQDGSAFLEFLERYYQRDRAHFESLTARDGTKIRPVLEMFKIAGPLPKDHSQPLIGQNDFGGGKPFNIRPDSVKIPKGVPLTMELAIDMALLAKANPVFADGIDVTGNAQQRAMLAAAAELVGLDVKNIAKVDQKLLAQYRPEAAQAWDVLKQRAEEFHKEDDTAINASKHQPQPDDIPPAPGPDPVSPDTKMKPEPQPDVKTTEAPKTEAPKTTSPVSPLAAAAAGAGAGAAAADALNNKGGGTPPAAPDAPQSQTQSSPSAPAAQPAAARPSVKMTEPAAPKPSTNFDSLNEDDRQAVKDMMGGPEADDAAAAKEWDDLPPALQRKLLADKDKHRKAADEFRKQAASATPGAPAAEKPTSSGTAEDKKEDPVRPAAAKAGTEEAEKAVTGSSTEAAGPGRAEDEKQAAEATGTVATPEAEVTPEAPATVPVPAGESVAAVKPLPAESITPVSTGSVPAVETGKMPEPAKTGRETDFENLPPEKQDMIKDTLRTLPQHKDKSDEELARHWNRISPDNRSLILSAGKKEPEATQSPALEKTGGDTVAAATPEAIAEIPGVQKDVPESAESSASAVPVSVPASETPSPQESTIPAADPKNETPVAEAASVPASTDEARTVAEAKPSDASPAPASQRLLLPAPAAQQESSSAKEDFTDVAAKEDKDAGKSGAQILSESNVDTGPHKLEDIYALVKVRVIEDDDASMRHVEDIIGVDSNIPGSKKIARVILKALEADGVVVRENPENPRSARKVAKPPSTQVGDTPSDADDDAEAGFGLPPSSAPRMPAGPA